MMRSLDALRARLDEGHDGTVLIDLDAQVAVAAIELCREADGRPKTIAFGSHVRTDLFDAARAAGADEVLARSAVVKRLPSLLA